MTNWQTKKLREVAGYSKTRINASALDSDHFIGVDCLIVDLGGKESSNHTPITGKICEYRKGDVLQSNIRPYLKKAYLANDTGGASADILVIRPDIKQILPEFLYFNITTNDYFSYVMSAAKGVKMPRGDKAHIMNFNLSIPSVSEQRAIVEKIQDFDDYLQKVQAKLEASRRFKKGLAQQIFSGQLRFKEDNGQDFPDWAKKDLGEILDEINLKTEKLNQYQTLSSTTKGLFLQSEYFNKDIASKDNIGYKILRKNQIVLSPQNLWMGNINWNDKFDIGIVSPSYRIFDIKNSDPGYVSGVLLSSRMLYEYMQVSEQGASIVRRNLDIENFLGIKIKVPSLSEQQKIAEFLSNIDEMITLFEQLLEKAKNQKKWLLDNLATGKIRLKEFRDE